MGGEGRGNVAAKRDDEVDLPRLARQGGEFTGLLVEDVIIGQLQ